MNIICIFRYVNYYLVTISLFVINKLDNVTKTLVTYKILLTEGERTFRIVTNQVRDEKDKDRITIKVIVVS